jgi:hypothetical protein
MANNYTQFSFGIAGWPKSAIDHVLALAAAVDALGQEDDVPSDTPDDLAARAAEIAESYSRGTDAQFDLDGDDLIIYSEESGCVGAVVDILQHAMATHGIAKPVVIEYADTCSKMRVGEFGGGCVVVTADETEWMDSRRWGEQNAARLASAVKPGGGSIEPKRYDDVECSNGNEFGVMPAPVSFEIDIATARRILSIASMLDRHDLWKAERFDYRIRWAETTGDEDEAAGEGEEIRTIGDVLCVTRDSFWFAATVKHADDLLETTDHSIAELAAHFGLAFPAAPSPLTILVRGGLVHEVLGHPGGRAVVLDGDVEVLDPSRVVEIRRGEGILRMVPSVLGIKAPDFDVPDVPSGEG